MTVIELRSAPLTRRTLIDDLLLNTAAWTSALVERRMARRAVRAVTGYDARIEGDRAAIAGAHAHGLLPR
ncbi:MAG: hypothetical protein ABWY03_05420 [Microbacterium sp.]